MDTCVAEHDLDDEDEPICRGCQQNNGYDVVVYDDVWHEAWGGQAPPCDGTVYMCRSCIERNIGRELTTDDMPVCLMNFVHFIREGWDEEMLVAEFVTKFEITPQKALEITAQARADGIISADEEVNVHAPDVEWLREEAYAFCRAAHETMRNEEKERG